MGMGSFTDRHKGRKCYVFGSGPSLNRFDCDKLALDGVTIFCNASIMAVKACDYYFFSDPRIADHKAYFPTVLDKARIVIANNSYIRGLCEKRFGDKLISRVQLVADEHTKGVKWTKDTLIGGVSCVEVAANLAYVMGCEPIILVGVDLKWDGSNKYFHDQSDPALWPPIENEGSAAIDASLSLAFECWAEIEKQNPGLPIFVANKDSRLRELYPCIDLSAFHKN